jgi:hypothetical protein
MLDCENDDEAQLKFEQVMDNFEATVGLLETVNDGRRLPTEKHKL